MKIPEIPPHLKKHLDPGLNQLIQKYSLVEDILEYTPLSTKRLWKELAEATTAVNKIRKQLPPNSTVWDVGTGMGLSAAALAKSRPDVTVIGIDKTHRKTWNILENYYIPNLKLIEANILDYAKTSPNKPDYIIGIHNCKALSIIDIELATKYNSGILLIPCCQDFAALKNALGFDIKTILPTTTPKYHAWAIGLTLLIKTKAPHYKTSIYESEFLGRYTPKNMIIHARPNR